MESTSERLRAVLAARAGVRLAYVFGSAARGALRSTSDVDVTAVLARYVDTAHLRRVQAEYLHAWAEAHRARAR
ncbi:MAG TPA: nucleotidyltransferase domain-containing protein [Candidatus Limnocylindria bacterium]|nr:nucleotidyltransferase domain-containing protein [Candidatus Limnocylindria bacterium]